MDKYLMFMKKVLDLKEDIENKIVEGKRKGYIFKTYKLGTNEFKVVDGLIIETKNKKLMEREKGFTPNIKTWWN